MIDLMLDVETLGNIPGCVVTQVTIVPFHLKGTPLGEEVKVFDQRLHIGNQMADGLEVNAETLNWWMQQDADVRRYVMAGDLGSEDFCFALTNYVGEIEISHKEYRIWSTSAKVDFGCIPFLFRLNEIPYCINHRSERCARTFIEMVKTQHPQMKLPKGLTTHNALDDCRRQIADLQCAYSTFRYKETNGEDVKTG